jgi:SAM-dependent methyltransferase
VDVALLERLRTSEGAAALAAADAVLDRDPLAAATALRQAGIDPELAAAALTQATLRQRARAKFGPDAAGLFFTRAGLEQATRAVVARRRAERLAAAGVRRVTDLGCGIGADARAFAAAGLTVTAVEQDPLTAAIARANTGVDVHCGDATTVDLTGADAVFCDPARRDRHRGRVFDPDAYSPPWSFVAALPQRVPMTVLKLAPGIDHALLPPGAEAEWVSVNGDVVEACVWAGPLAQVPRRATLLRGERADVLTGTGVANAPVAALRPYLYDPDGAVVRSHLVAEFAQSVDGTLADPHIAYVFADAPRPTPFAPCWRIREQFGANVRTLRKELAQRGIGRLEIRKRGLAIDPDQFRRDLRLHGTGSATLVLARLGTMPTAFLCEPG